MSHRLFTFVGGEVGAWRVLGLQAVIGAPIAQPKRLDVVAGSAPGGDAPGCWALRGITSNDRYVMASEKRQLLAQQQGLDRSQAVRAALLPIRKSAAWWALSQDERRKIFEEQSQHIQLGLRHLPTATRRLHHCRDLGEDQPFDFLTWFEFTADEEPAFNALLLALRASREWTYVERELDLRLLRESI